MLGNYLFFLSHKGSLFLICENYWRAGTVRIVATRNLFIEANMLGDMGRSLDFFDSV
jgi:hypothetical protein